MISLRWEEINLATQDFFRVGELLRNQERQYAVQFEAVSKTWLIVDLWHEALRELAPSDEIPRDSEAITTITEGQFTLLLTEADRLGLLSRFTGSNALDADFTNPMDSGPIDLSGERTSGSGKQLIDSRHAVRMKALDVISRMIAGDDTSYLSSF